MTNPSSCTGLRLLAAGVLLFGWQAAACAADGPPPPRRMTIPSERLIQYPSRQLHGNTVQVTSLLHVAEARAKYNVDGSGLTVAVLDTGLRTTHQDFAGKVLTQRNFTSDNGGAATNVSDANGHGTNVAGIICAKGVHTGIAPGAKVIPLKVLANNGAGTDTALVAALDWVIANRATYQISVINMSLGDTGNYASDGTFAADAVRQRLVTLRGAKVAVCVAAGNSFGTHNSKEGMSHPAICRESISVGATFDADLGPVDYLDTSANSTAAGRFCPFSQRLHPSTNSLCRTDIFVPGAALTSAGITNDTSESTAHGTSQATPIVSGLVLLAQQYWLRKRGSLPTVDQLESWLRNTKYTLIDGDDEDDDVLHNLKSYPGGDGLELTNVVAASVGGGNPPPQSPTNNVVATYDPVTRLLTLTGDAGTNSVIVTFQYGKLTVKGGSSTSINSKTEVFAPAVVSPFNVTCNLLGNSDSLTFTGVPMNALTINLGDGCDTLQLNYCNIQQLKLDGGPMSDVFTSVGSVIKTKTVTSVP